MGGALNNKVQCICLVCGRSKFAMDLKERGSGKWRKALNEEQRVWTMSCLCVCGCEGVSKFCSMPNCVWLYCHYIKQSFSKRERERESDMIRHPCRSKQGERREWRAATRRYTTRPWRNSAHICDRESEQGKSESHTSC